MQLFITPYTKKQTTITIDNVDLLAQVRKVLRLKIGDTIRIQDPGYEAEKSRYELRIDDRDSSVIQGTIVSEQEHKISPDTTTMIIAMPNKWDKAELIVQKLSEIGITHIIFRPSERSIIKQWNTKKAERMEKISKEAVEQSRGRRLPEIIFTNDIKKYINNKHIVIFDKQAQEESRGNIEKSTKDIVGIIGPEGGFTEKDYQNFEGKNHQIIGLGTNILRMETATIIGARLLKNNE